MHYSQLLAWQSLYTLEYTHVLIGLQPKKYTHMVDIKLTKGRWKENENEKDKEKEKTNLEQQSHLSAHVCNHLASLQ